MDYEKHYNRLIERAKSRSRVAGYNERHHVVPKVVGGSHHVDNIVRLTPEEHYLAHLLLVRMTTYKDHPNFNRLIFAAVMMTVGSGRNNKSYGWVKRRLGEIRSQLFRGRRQSAEHIAKRVARTTGQKRTAETRERCRQSKLGVKRKPFTQEHIEKLRQASLGRSHSESSKAKMREAHLGKPKPSPSPQHIKRLTDLARGRKDSPETTRRRSEAAKTGWLKRKQKNGTQQP